MPAPLADRIRPTCLEEIAGQKHILAPGSSPLYHIVKNKMVANLIFYGPPGTGKTTTARLIASQAGLEIFKLNATSATTKDVRDVLAKAESAGSAVLYLDEIQYFTKKQQQSLLEATESGKLYLIASTTENPYFYVYNALLSRSSVFEFKALTPEDALPAICRALDVQAAALGVSYEPGLAERIASACGGDLRRAVNVIELLTSTMPLVTLDAVDQLCRGNNMNFDRDGDVNYDLASGLHKSMRGSDPDAALYYLARLLHGGDLVTPSRRILCAACEDVGLAYPNAIVVAKACVDAAMQLGLPEAYLPLSQAVVMICQAPKSNSLHEAFALAKKDVDSGLVGAMPRHLQNVHADSAGQERDQGYLYPHDFPNHYVPQQYLPDCVLGRRYYVPGDNPTEQSMAAYWHQIKGPGPH